MHDVKRGALQSESFRCELMAYVTEIKCFKGSQGRVGVAKTNKSTSTQNNGLG